MSGLGGFDEAVFVDAVTVIGDGGVFVETDADRAFQPQPDCCEDCDDALAQMAGATS